MVVRDCLSGVSLSPPAMPGELLIFDRLHRQDAPTHNTLHPRNRVEERGHLADTVNDGDAYLVGDVVKNLRVQLIGYGARHLNGLVGP